MCIFLALCIAVGIYSAIVNAYIKGSADDYITERNTATADGRFEGADCIIVLGCGVDDDGRPKLLLRDRLDCGIDLYHAGAAPKLLMSGDHGRTSYDEVNSMKKWAVDAGVSSTDVFMDHAGFSTYETMYRARDIFGAKKVVIVTQRYHLYRAVYIARALGLEAYGVACDPGEYYGQIWLDSREYLARNKDFWYCILKPEPTFLGDAIPINGDGNATNDRWSAEYLA
ncbi:MAG: SanA protein [Ruminococcaceae bacterium]|nr:SanA protein [Oscillospiraceae bacterium]